MQVRQDADEVARLLGVCSDKHLILQELQEVRREGPAFDKVSPLPGLFRRWRTEQPKVLVDMTVEGALNCRRAELQPVF